MKLIRSITTFKKTKIEFYRYDLFLKINTEKDKRINVILTKDYYLVVVEFAVSFVLVLLLLLTNDDDRV